ncbi:PREDICTED: uncharacterized protein LOC109221975 [Nicotiana attenuata]|uniref:uncharacterized protein LOC109221975 n=1 Tax=Nicotiana attenuata TaxID=49451 RepID=UPI0009049EC0|nr:PREDICTED: uncharacterized protein LOC109221975 [Nicotiana attenuata]
MKDFEKFNDGDFGRKKPRKQANSNISSEPENPTPDSPYMSSPNLSSFSLNLNEDVAGDSTSSQRPSGVKKSKMKRKIDEEYMKTIQSDNNRMVEAMNNATQAKMEVLTVLKEKVRVKEMKEENKILMMNVDSIVDPARREFMRQEQQRIMYKRSQEYSQSQPQQSSAPFSNDFGVSGNDIGPY